MENRLKAGELYREIAPILENMGYRLVEASLRRVGRSDKAAIAIYRPEREVNTDDCALVSNTVHPRLEMKSAGRDVELEVSTPGLGRNIKDAGEFEIFTGKDVRIYSSLYSSWVTGRIESTDEGSITLRDAEVVDTKEKIPSLRVEFDKIQKAKLDQRWEGERE